MNEQLHAEALTNFLKCLDFDIDLQAHHFNEDADPAVVGEAFMEAYRTNFEEYHGEEWIDARVPVTRACDIKDSLLAKAMGWDQPAFPCLKKGE
jgi:hypothetical protein